MVGDVVMIALSQNTSLWRVFSFVLLPIVLSLSYWLSYFFPIMGLELTRNGSCLTVFGT